MIGMVGEVDTPPKDIKSSNEEELKQLEDEFRKLQDQPLKLEELSKKYKISRERVRQIEEKAMEKLKKEILKIQ